MSSHSNPYQFHQGHINYESSPGPPVSRHSRSPEQSWPSTTPIDNQSGYSQPYQSVDPVRDQLEAHDAEDMTYSVNQLRESVPLQVPGVRMDATYTNDVTPLQPSTYSPYTMLGYEQVPHQSGYASYGPFYDPQLYVPNAQISLTQDLFTPQTSQGLSVSNYPYPSLSQPPSLDHGGLVYQTGPDAPLIPANVSQSWVNTATLELPDGNAGQHSHSLPVAASSLNRSSVAGPSRPWPVSPERRFPPLQTIEQHPTARRVAPRLDRARRSQSTDSYISGRGRVIPQQRYTSNTISYNTPASRVFIGFNLENPDQTGIPIVDILNRTGSFAHLQDRTEAFDMGKMTFTLRILWPGYEPWSKTISALDWRKTRAPIKREKLAEVVAKAVRDLIKKKRNQRCQPEYAEWNIGRDGIQLEQICLVALCQVSRGSWQPRFCLIESAR